MKVAEIKVFYEPKMKISECAKINSSAIVNTLLGPKFEENMEFREMGVILLLNRANYVKGYHIISLGGISGTVMDVGIILAIAVKTLSSAIIMDHNHPSGNMRPSEADRKLTEQVRKACKLFDKQLLDHLIMTESGYYSFADEGNL